MISAPEPTSLRWRGECFELRQQERLLLHALELLKVESETETTMSVASILDHCLWHNANALKAIASVALDPARTGAL